MKNAVIRPRHIKLWLTGKAQNWKYAKYERYNISGALVHSVTAIPIYKDQPTANLIAAFATPQLAQLEVAIKTKNQSTLVAAYEHLTASYDQHCQATIIRWS